MKSVGVLSFYPAFYPPKSGGELRLYNLYRRLADRRFKVDMVAPTYSDHQIETIHHADRFQELRLPKTDYYNKLHGLNDRFPKFSECSGLVCSIACTRHPEFVKEAERLSEQSDILVQECMFLTPLVPKKRKKGQLLVYASQNVESRLAAAMFGDSLYGRMGTRRIRNLEARMLHESDIVFACSEEDGLAFQQDFGLDRTKLHIVPNGVDVEALRPVESPEQRQSARDLLQLTNGRPACFFIGSFHPPNIEAAEIIIDGLAKLTPDADFLIAGKVCNAFAERKLPPNVRMLGLVDEAQKMALFHGCDIALNTMVSGSGTNLKMLDYFSAGLPVLTTSCGARGLSIEHCRQANVQEPAFLAQGLKDMLESEAFRKELGREGRKHAVDHFSWRAIGDRVADLFTVKTGRRIVILNDYAVMPAEQGGQVRVEAVAKNLSAGGMNVTVLTLSTNGYRRQQISPNLEEINIPRSYMHRRMDMRFNAWAGCGCDDVSALMFSKTLTPEFTRVLKREVRNAEAVMLSHPYMETLTHDIPSSVKLYYDSHNTEFELKQKLYRKSLFCRYLIRRTKKAELSAARRAKAGFCVSDENRRQITALVKKFSAKSYVAPNGVDCSAAIVRTREEKVAMREKIGLRAEAVAIFLGSGHPPNAEAARIIRDHIAPCHPKVLFLLVGNVVGWFHGQGLGPNVMPIGAVATPVKNYLLQCSDFALNPMLTGSGTSLKLFDYLAHGLPVISTPVGARGLEDSAKEALVITGQEHFADELRRLLQDPERCEAMSKASRKLAEEHFDWPVALRPMREIIVGAE